MAVAVIPILKTAPELLPYYEEVSLLGMMDFEQLASIQNDLIIRNWFGEGQIFQKSLQNQFAIKLHGITPANLFILEKWYHNRMLLRLNGWYNQYTKFYAPLFRAGGVELVDPGYQIAIPTEDPTFARAHSATKVAYYVGADGLHYPSSNNVPRYQEGYKGLRGILLEGDTTNYAYRSFPDSGNLIWLSGVGTPTVAWQAEEPQHVYGFAGAVQASLGAIGNTCYWTNSNYGAATKYSFGVWLKGQGTVRLKLTNVTGGPLYTSELTLSPHSWQLLKYENFAISASPVRVDIESRQANTTVFIGGLQLEGDNPITSFILNQSGTGNYTRDMDDLKWANQKIPQEEGALFVVMKQPGGFEYATGAAETPILSGSYSNDFQLKFKKSTNYWYFHAKTSSIQIGFATTKGEGDDTLISTTWHDLQYGQAIYEDGTYKNSSSHSAIYTKSKSIEAGIQSTGRGPNTVISAIRIDGKRYTNADMETICDEMVDDEKRKWLASFEGRNFIIEDFKRRMMAGHPDKYEGEFVLREISSAEQATIFDR